jgi:hypothetical protein
MKGANHRAIICRVPVYLLDTIGWKIGRVAVRTRGRNHGHVQVYIALLSGGHDRHFLERERASDGSKKRALSE